MNRLSLLVAVVTMAATSTLSPVAGADTSLPPCPQSNPVITPTGKSPQADCTLHSGDLDFAVQYWSVPELPRPRAVKVTVTDPSGAVVQTIDELLEPSTPGGVGLQDVDGDGRDELIIPISQNLLNGANPNTRFAVWRAHDDSRHYERTQMVGQAAYPSGDGYLVTNGGGLASRDLTFYLPTGAGYTLVTVLTIEVLEVDPATNRVLTVNCRAHQEDGLHAVDMSIRQAEDYFCNSPAARAIWPDAERVQIKRWGLGGN
ncbi:FG-GAP repeat protein [uncultured Mycobacterium sp.]|uniref:FG-GAP repeat protein n=1 Tax=uncultured Mycobacterium sp. TaxID=171292 RepID=A0A1Y5PMW1_9MYCO|nr:FG-GAP repeat protein [uncultured Mycobacterium sp.]